MRSPDAIVVGSGPNGLSAAVALARAGLAVLVLEAQPSCGGGARSAELTLPGFVHDLCSGIHPLAFASPFFRSLALERFGLEWVHSPAALVHSFDDATALTVEHSLADMRAELGRDGPSYEALLAPATKAWTALLARPSLPAALPALLRAAPLGVQALRSITSFVRTRFRLPGTRALLAGAAAHSMLALDKATTAGVALGLLTMAHAGGWPFPRGGAQKISDALAACLRSLGGEIVTSQVVRDLRELPPARAVLLDLTPRQVLALAGPLLPPRYARILARFRYGPAAFKLDWALSQPVPWRAPAAQRAATLHLGGSLAEIAAGERAAWRGSLPERPFVIAAQHSRFDPTRAPAGRHTLWAYCHVPHGSEADMVARVEAQIERFAPGFRDCILARSVLPPRALETHNANLVGGDITGGIQDLWQIVFRPTTRYWTTPVENLYLCSSSTPPGVGVHGMCGYLAARAALKRTFGMECPL